jgi:acetate kinase
MPQMLVINAGSSSTKISRFAEDDLAAETPVDAAWEADIDWGERTVTVTAAGPATTEPLATDDRREILRQLLTLSISPSPSKMERGSEGGAITAVGHRVVHGGARYEQPTRITPEVEAAIAALAPDAPAHNRAALEGIQVAREVLGDVPQIAVFDTAFHRTLPLAAQVYPGPYAWYEQGIRRFGFHGISHHYAALRAGQLLGRDTNNLDLITCHLGSGASLAAVHHGRSVATTMGFTPLDGIMMATRAGSVDPGILLHLLRQPGMTVETLDRTLEHESGLLGVSGVSGDMRVILDKMAADDARARLAFDIYIHRLAAGISALRAALGGLDALVFTGGVGEHAAAVRAAACVRLAFLGVAIDAAKNDAATGDADISAAGSGARTLVVRARENWMIARACHAVLSAS